MSDEEGVKLHLTLQKGDYPGLAQSLRGWAGMSLDERCESCGGEFYSRVGSPVCMGCQRDSDYQRGLVRGRLIRLLETRGANLMNDEEKRRRGFPGYERVEEDSTEGNPEIDWTRLLWALSYCAGALSRGGFVPAPSQREDDRKMVGVLCELSLQVARELNRRLEKNGDGI